MVMATVAPSSTLGFIFYTGCLLCCGLAAYPGRHLTKNLNIGLKCFKISISLSNHLFLLFLQEFVFTGMRTPKWFLMLAVAVNSTEMISVAAHRGK